VASNGGRNVCPTDWHAPTIGEWGTLTNPLGGQYVAGGKLKETGTSHWTTPILGNFDATNEVGFTALPGGYRCKYGDTYAYIGRRGYWRSTTKASSTYGLFIEMSNSDPYVEFSNYEIEDGYSVRCVRD